jgi:hypothetical protein
VLRLQARSVIFSYLDECNRDIVQEYAFDNYQSWLKDDLFRGQSVDDIVLVIGTYMTQNWEARTYVSNSTQSRVRGNIDVPQLLNFHGKVDREVWQRTAGGYSCGHLHEDTPTTEWNEDQHFQDCCNTCDPIPQTQCIFLRTSRIRERGRIIGKPLAEQTVQQSEATEKVVNRTVLWFRRSGSSRSTRLESSDQAKGTMVKPVDHLELEIGASDDGDCVGVLQSCCTNHSDRSQRPPFTMKLLEGSSR